MKITIIEALISLKPKAQWILNDLNYSGLEWKDENQTKPTEEEINAKVVELEAEEPFKLLREERNKRLAECDWIVTKNAEYGQNISKEWRAYRQALRDLPSISYRPELDEYENLKMDSVAWPTPPE